MDPTLKLIVSAVIVAVVLVIMYMVERRL